MAWKLDIAPARHTMFPLARCEGEFNLRRVATMPDAAIAKIANWQPYHLAHSREWRAEVLWQLETLVNVDKHRHLNLMLAATGNAFSWDPPGSAPNLHKGPVRAGTVIARCPAGSWKRELGVAPALAFADLPKPRFGSGDVYGVLFNIETVVDFLVEDFRAEFFPGLPRLKE